MHVQNLLNTRQVHGLARQSSCGMFGGDVIRKSLAAKSASANAKPQVASTTQPAANILVIGAGVAGLTSALRILQEVPNAKCTVVADKLAALTTSHGAAGLWGPYKLSDTPEDQIMRWSAETHRHLQELYHSPEAAPAGISTCQCHWLHDAPTPPPFWAPIVHQWQPMEERELALFNASWAAQAPPLVQGWAHQSLLCEGRWYLEWLHQRVASLGGRVMISPRPLHALSQLFVQDGWQLAPVPTDNWHAQQMVQKQQQQQQPGFYSAQGNDTLSSSSSSGSNGSSSQSGSDQTGLRVPFDLVVNCAGLGAQELMSDAHVHPIRGQIMRVHAPWIRSAYMCGDSYIIPNRDSVVLGGTGQVGDYCLEARAEERERIWQKCCALMPSLAQAEVLHDWVGLRPGRTRVRLEAEVVELSLPLTEQSSGSEGRGGSEDFDLSSPQDPNNSSSETKNSHSYDRSENSSRHDGILDGTSAGQLGNGGDGASGRKSVRMPVVHCYGHGGAGLTLGWGCAGDVVVHVQSMLHGSQQSK